MRHTPGTIKEARDAVREDLLQLLALEEGGPIDANLIAERDSVWDRMLLQHELALIYANLVTGR